MLAPGLAQAVPYTPALSRSKRRKQFAVSINFADWPEWQDAFRVLLAQSRLRHVTRVGISAGRADGTFYRSTHEHDAWSDIQHTHTGDMVEAAVDALGERDICSTAVLDVVAPRYLQKRPEHAALDMRGRRSSEVVCSTSLAEGEYGRVLTDAFEALAASTGADSVSVTNLYYGWHCFCRRCFLRFREHTMCSDWPRLTNGAIDLNDPGLGKWRSSLVASIVSRVGAVVRAHGKRMLFEAKLSADDPSRKGRENGQDHALLRAHVDEFVVRDEFAFDEAACLEAVEAARYLGKELGTDAFWYCVELWHRDGALRAEQMRNALLSALRGGARRLWIASSYHLSPLHWQLIDELMSRDDAVWEGVASAQKIIPTQVFTRTGEFGEDERAPHSIDFGNGSNLSVAPARGAAATVKWVSSPR